MKITIVLGPFQMLPPAGFGAVEKVWCELAGAFVERGHNVNLIGRGANGRRKYVNQTGINILERKGFKATGKLFIDLIKDLLYAVSLVKVIPKSDIVVTNSFWLPVVLTPLKRLKGKILVHIQRFPKGQMWLYQAADRLQTVSSIVADGIVHQCPWMKNKICVLPNPINLQIFHMPEQQRRYDGLLTVLYVGRVHPEKGLDLLISAFKLVLKKHKQACLRIIGPTAVEQGGGGKAYFEKLMSDARRLPVTFMEPIHDPDMLSTEYWKAHCFCYPSLADSGEALPVAPLEAMATGLPVILSDIGCFRDFVRHGENALVFDHRAPGAVKFLADAIDTVLGDPEQSSRLGLAACAITGRFALENIAEEYLQMFEDVIHSTGVSNGHVGR